MIAASHWSFATVPAVEYKRAVNTTEPGAQLPEDTSPASAGAGRGRWLIHLLVIGSYPVILGLLGMNRSGNAAPALTHTSRGLVITCLIQLGVFALIFFIGWLASRVSREQLLLRWRGGVWPVPLGILYSVGLRFGLAMIAIGVLAVLLTTQVVTPEQAQQFSNENRPDVTAMVDIAALRADPVYFWLTVTFVSFVVAGLREELWRTAVLAAFRALWPGRFSSRGGQMVAVTIIALAFGVGHLSMGPLAVVAAVLLGLGLGAIIVFHGSIWPAVIAHGMFDATTFAVLPWVMEKLPRG